MINKITTTHAQPHYHINWQELRKAYWHKSIMEVRQELKIPITKF